ncbi:MAG: isopentenyl phosphate kinase, partial [Nitrososphaerales archaeon]
RPLAINPKAIRKAAKAISKSLKLKYDQKLFLIHGGGSFGHYYATKFHLSTIRSKVTAEGVSRTAAAMITLHSIVLDSLVCEGVPCKTVVTSEFLSDDGKEVTERGKNELEFLFRNNFVPISYGNVSATKKGSAIISGDQITLNLARKLVVERVIFAMDVDGIYPDSRMKGDVINELDMNNAPVGKKWKYDVTGGIGAKIETGFRLAKLGADVFYVNGNKGGRLESLLAGKDDVKATRIFSNSIST